MTRRIFLQRTPENNSARWRALPAEILARLANEGIRSAADWRALSPRRRRSLFGIVPRMVRAIDRAARR